MAYDRTQEFVEAVERLGPLGAPQTLDARKPFSDEDRQFNALAAEMGNMMHATSLKLQELGKCKGLLLNPKLFNYPKPFFKP